MKTRANAWKELMYSPVKEEFNLLKRSTIPREALQNIEVDIERSVHPECTCMGPLEAEAREYNVIIRKKELRDVLVAFAKYNSAIEYCQGLSYYAAFLLQLFTPEESFSILCKTIQKNRIERLFDKKLSLVSKVLSVHERVLNLTLPEAIRKSIQSISNSTHDYSAGWYLTLFSRLSPSLYTVVLDLFYTRGFPVLFHAASALVEVGHRNYITEGVIEHDQRMQILFKLADYPIPEDEFREVLQRNIQMVSLATIEHMLSEIDSNIENK
ncbi:ecotropic viral integration site 5 protein [Nematocida minor]|uniref:ecotropic viral integration site 5 protein n=1 Tax=Nematocida minor TaxID=1912983 RepID=UPI00221F5DBA|nr:ecotropic viral integration site 5 protein [Nematocida minor]KAI5191917.1 ecotropic viral integration site 5 protein [Nematocida minor]